MCEKLNDLQYLDGKSICVTPSFVRHEENKRSTLRRKITTPQRIFSHRWIKMQVQEKIRCDYTNGKLKFHESIGIGEDFVRVLRTLGYGMLGPNQTTLERAARLDLGTVTDDTIFQSNSTASTRQSNDRVYGSISTINYTARVRLIITSRISRRYSSPSNWTPWKSYRLACSLRWRNSWKTSSPSALPIPKRYTCRPGWILRRLCDPPRPVLYLVWSSPICPKSGENVNGWRLRRRYHVTNYHTDLRIDRPVRRQGVDTDSESVGLRDVGVAPNRIPVVAGLHVRQVIVERGHFLHQ